MEKHLNFTQFFKDYRKFGYLRKILAVKENDVQNPGHNYGTISQSQYFNGEEMVSVCCENGDCFIIRDLIDADQFDQKIHMYFLVTVDFSEKNNVRLLGSFCQMSSEKDSPHPENLIVEKLIQRGLFQPEQN